MYVCDDRMVCFSVQNQSQVSPTYSKGNLSIISGHFTLFLLFSNSSMLFSPALTDMASSLQQLVTGHLSSTVSEVILCVDKSGSSCLQVQAHLQH